MGIGRLESKVGTGFETNGNGKFRVSVSLHFLRWCMFYQVVLVHSESAQMYVGFRGGTYGRDSFLRI